MNPTRYLLPIACLLTMACSGDEETPKDTDTGSNLAPDSTEYYDVTGEMNYGIQTFDVRMAASRTIQPATSSILEVFHDLQQGDTTEAIINIDLETNAFTGSLEHPEMTCDSIGQFEGEAWAWHAWESTSTCTGGITIVSVDTMDENGIIADKVGTFADGTNFTQREILTPITETEWQALVAEFEALTDAAE